MKEGEMFIQSNIQENKEMSVEELNSLFKKDHTEGIARAFTEVKKITDPKDKKEFWEKLCKNEEFKKQWENLKLVVNSEGRAELENIVGENNKYEKIIK